ncbi:MAG: rhomboid family intramembrane serine protease [Deltaproteobacteria bacterium]|nr:rhomboid family intramembrane serine protease [Deltaproteobacteria bacterium]
MFPLRDTIPARRFPVVTVTLIALNTAVFLFQLTLSETGLQALFLQYGIVPARWTDTVWANQHGLGFSLIPFLTTQFLHGGWLHLLGNMWMLWVFGDNVEDRFGRWRFLAFYLVAGGIAGLAHFLSGPQSEIPAVGASGAIAGVLGAYFLLFPTSRVLTLIPIFFYPLLVELRAFIFLGIWFLMQLFSGTVSLFGSLLGSGATGIAWWAHIGGFVAGLLSLRLFRLSRPRGQGKPSPRVIRPWGPEGPALIDPASPTTQRRPRFRDPRNPFER